MKLMQRLSIKVKLVSIILLVSMFVLILGFSLVVYNNIQSFKQDMYQNTLMHARLIGEYCVYPLAFQDSTGASDVLKKLQSIPHITGGYLYDLYGNLFACYERDGCLEPLGTAPSDEGNGYHGQFLHILHQIEYDDYHYGSIYLVASTEALSAKIRNYLFVIVLVISALVLLSYLLAIKLQAVISKPILKLASVTEKISNQADYSVRVQPSGDDEIGVLYQGFNNMLEQLHIREMERDRAEAALRESENRYRNIFETAAVSIWEEDFSDVHHSLDRLKTEGVTNFSDYFDRNPQFVENAIQMVKVLNVNDVTLKMFGGKDKQALIGSLNKFYIPETVHFFKSELLAIVEGRSHFEGETIYKKMSGECINVLMRMTVPNQNGEFNRVLVSIVDITKRKQAEAAILRSLKEKEVMLQEIHHRVKNNMQVISSLLNLQSRHILDSNALTIFKESQNRVRSMALVHEKLYRSGDLSKIDFSEYIHSLVSGLYRSYGTNPANIQLNTHVESVALGIDLAVPCGLIINELVSNSLKHAFPNGQIGKIDISLTQSKNQMVHLVVSDSGVGIPDDIDFKRTESLGLHLVVILVEDQLRGTIDLKKEKGSRFEVTFSPVREVQTC